MTETIQWRGAVIAEGLRDQALVNGLRVFGAFITEDGQPLAQDGSRGRYHLYWAEVSEDEIDIIQAMTLRGWYAYFWQGDDLLVVYDDARFTLSRHDPSTWAPAIDHGLHQGLRREWLNFPTNESTDDLS